MKKEKKLFPNIKKASFPTVHGITKEHWSTGNIGLDKKLEQLVYDIINTSSLRRNQLKRECEIESLIQSFPQYNKLILDTLKSKLEIHLRQPQPKGNLKSDAGKIWKLRRTGTENILKWLNDGMKDNPETGQMKFEDLLTDIDVKKIQSLLNSYKHAKPEALAVLCYALDLGNLKKKTLLDMVNAKFDTHFERKAFSYQLDQCSDRNNKRNGRYTLIENVRKQIRELTE